MSRIIHPIEPIYDNNSRILILGSFPSVKSREEGFFYGHPQNRFWKVMAAVFEDSLPVSIPEKRDFLLRNRVALWDVIASCEITGSSDASIKNVKVNDLSRILDHADIKSIFVNGKTAEKMFRLYTAPLLKEPKIEPVVLPSTSSANAAWSLERLTKEWQERITHHENTGRGAWISDSPTKRIYDAVKSIPRGRVATYGTVAALAGNPKMARAVGNALHKNPDPDNIPCYRVVNASGKLAEAFVFGGVNVQERLLKEDGIEVKNGFVDLDKYGWRGSF